MGDSHTRTPAGAGLSSPNRVAAALLTETTALARQRGRSALTTYASLAAKPLFERHGCVR